MRWLPANGQKRVFATGGCMAACRARWLKRVLEIKPKHSANCAAGELKLNAAALNWPLNEKIQGIKRLTFTGVTTEVCVQTSMREANDRGYDGLIVEDATESHFPIFKAAALRMLTAQGAIVGRSTHSQAPLGSLP